MLNVVIPIVIAYFVIVKSISYFKSNENFTAIMIALFAGILTVMALQPCIYDSSENLFDSLMECRKPWDKESDLDLVDLYHLIANKYGGKEFEDRDKVEMVKMILPFCEYRENAANCLAIHINKIDCYINVMKHCSRAE